MIGESDIFAVERGDRVGFMHRAGDMLAGDVLLLGDHGAVRYEGNGGDTYRFTTLRGKRPVSVRSDQFYVSNHRLSVLAQDGTEGEGI